MDLEPPRASTGSASSFHFLKLCKRRSVAVSSSKADRNPNCYSSSDDAVNGHDDDSRDHKVHPQPLGKPLVSRSKLSEEAIILKLFELITALKCVYVQLQQAHIPYEPKKIKLADEVVVSVLKTLSNLEEAYMSQSSLSSEILEYQNLLALLQSELRIKDFKIRRMRREIEELDTENAALEKAVKQKVSPEKNLFSPNSKLTPSQFSIAFRITAKSIHDFAKPLISLMKASGWDLDWAVSSIDDSLIFAERSHKKYAFEAYLSRVMLSAAIADESFTLDHLDRVMVHQDPFDALMEDPDSWFGRFCITKYPVAVSSKMESSFFGNLDQRSFVLSGGHPRTPFYRAFARMARWAWALQVMANSFIPKAEIFYAEKGHEFSKDFMESVEPRLIWEGGEKLKVEFTVTPGFRISNTIIGCRVYLSKMDASINNSGLQL